MTSRPSPAPQTLVLAPTAENLERLVMLRYLMVAAMAAALAVATPMDMAWNPEPMALTLGLLVAVNMVTHWRVRQVWPVANAEFLGHLLLDVIALTALLYWSGGSGNPLVSLYLIPVVVAAAALPAAHTWFMAALTVGCYSWLILTQDPLPEHHDHGGEASFIDFHLTGMWLTFALSAGLVALFVGRMARSLRERDRRLAAAREESLRNERIVALGTMAAGAAHELGTPLGTMALLVDEIEPGVAGNAQAAQDLGEMRRQIGICKRIISDLLASAGHARGEGGSPQTADQFLRDVVSKWEMMRPSARFDFRWESGGPDPAILAEQTLSQAVINLLNNAADASPEHIEIEGRCVEDEMVIEIRDQGPGLTPEVLSKAGQPFFSTKGPGKGSGLGLFLANATIERFGGTVRLFNREGGGACTEVRLPLEPLLAEVRR